MYRVLFATDGERGDTERAAGGAAELGAGGGARERVGGQGRAGAATRRAARGMTPDAERGAAGGERTDAQRGDDCAAAGHGRGLEQERDVGAVAARKQRGRPRHGHALWVRAEPIWTRIDARVVCSVCLLCSKYYKDVICAADIRKIANQIRSESDRIR